MRPQVVDGLQMLGGLAILIGSWLVFPPASLVLAGLALIAWAEGRRSDDADPDHGERGAIISRQRNRRR